MNVVVEWAKTMTWRGIHPIVRLVDAAYERGKPIAGQMNRRSALRTHHRDGTTRNERDWMVWRIWRPDDLPANQSNRAAKSAAPSNPTHLWVCW